MPQTDNALPETASPMPAVAAPRPEPAEIETGTGTGIESPSEAQPRLDNATHSNAITDAATPTTPKPPSSARRVAASRANGARSNGPTTDEGRARLALSPRNLKHGVLAQSVVLASEAGPRFDTLMETLIKEFKPANSSELTHVEIMATALWRYRRSLTFQKTDLDMEVAAHQQQMEASTSPAVIATCANRVVNERDSSFSSLVRYEVVFERQYWRALRQLKYLIKERLKSGQSPALADDIALWQDSCFNFDDPRPENEVSNEL